MPRYIDAGALDNRIKAEWAKQVDETKGYYGLAHFFVETQPTADVAPVCHAHWKHIVYHNGCTYDEDMICSVCGKSGVPYWEYCPNCGAKMDEEMEEEK